METVSIWLPEASIEGLEDLVRMGMYPSRSSVIRTAIRDLLKKEVWKNEQEQTKSKKLYSFEKLVFR